MAQAKSSVAAQRYDPERYPLLAAAEAGDKIAVARLLMAEADPNERTPEGWTALIMASKEGHTSIVKQLLMGDAEINPPKEGKWADPDPPNGTHTALRGAAIGGQLACIKLLLENEADPNGMSAGDRTPLMGAAMSGHKEVVDLLLGSGAAASAVNTAGETARALAEAQGHADIARACKAGEAPAKLAQQGLSVGQAADLLASYLEGAKVDE